MIVTVLASYVRHSDGVWCEQQHAWDIGGTPNWKELWSLCFQPDHRLWKMEVVGVDGLPFAEWAALHPQPIAHIPYNSRETAKKSRGKK